MYFDLLPPEINSARMYAGPGSGPLLTAAEAWDALAAQLHTTAASYSAVIAGLTTAWQGSSATSMATAAAPYVAWLHTTATEAEQTAAQARAAAIAYEGAFAAIVPPPVVAANRSELAFLVATNIFGQNTSAIAANEAQYSQMWARDAAAMSTYAAQSSSAATVTPFAAPASTTNPGGLLAQLQQTAQILTTSVGSSTQTQLSQLFGAVPTALHNFATIMTGPDPAAGLLTTLQDFAGLQNLDSIAVDVEIIPKLILPVNDVLINTILGLVIGARGVTVAAAGSTGAAATAGGLGSGAHLVGSAGVAGAGSPISAALGHAGVLAGMSVPPSWATATPAIRTVAAVLSGSGHGAIAADAVSEGTLLSGVAAAALAGTAFGATVPSALSGAGSRLRCTSLKDAAAKDAESPETLQRVVAEMADKPDNVQHWHTDSAGLESLIAKLKKKPGIHAVHLTDGEPSITLPALTRNQRPLRVEPDDY
ncbi:PPE family protein [Mycobacterium marinum]|uniref:PPE family protein n=1 Tax=Mycobacterium marinum TaxID=1781 RepID=UPI0035651AFF